MDCQICLRRLSLVEPVYRMGLGPAINNGLPTSVCERCFDALIRSLKRPGLRDGFPASQPCEVCERPVYDLKGSKVTRVVCSPGCRGVIEHHIEIRKLFWLNHAPDTARTCNLQFRRLCSI